MGTSRALSAPQFSVDNLFVLRILYGVQSTVHLNPSQNGAYGALRLPQVARHFNFA